MRWLASVFAVCCLSYDDCPLAVDVRCCCLLIAVGCGVLFFLLAYIACCCLGVA